MMDDRTKKLSEAFGPTVDCPSIEELVLLVDGERGTESRKRIEAHLAHCAYCETELAMYREFVSPQERPEERPHVNAIVERLRKNSPVERTSWWQRIWNIKVLAPASLVLAAAALVVMVTMPRASNKTPDVSTVDDTLRSGQVSVIGPIGTIQTLPEKFEWQPVKGANQYKVTVAEVDNTPVWAGETSTPTTLIPAEVKAKIQPLKTLKWRVMALGSSGSIIADSGPQTFRMER